MNGLRTTRRAIYTARAGATALFVGLLGCGTPTPPGPQPQTVGSADPAWITIRPALPSPNLDRLAYDARTRTLTLYDLTGNDRWEVQLPGETVGHPVAGQHRLPDVDPAQVYVYYSRPGVRPSVPVTVKQILDSGGVHVSMR
ncbi:MAG: hypothetical protein FJ304_17545 [Planctomycetes bacterium]|nr:hypothetical protein [Planctomycetota bacterium]